MKVGRTVAWGGGGGRDRIKRSNRSRAIWTNKSPKELSKKKKNKTKKIMCVTKFSLRFQNVFQWATRLKSSVVQAERPLSSSLLFYAHSGRYVAIP